MSQKYFKPKTLTRDCYEYEIHKPSEIQKKRKKLSNGLTKWKCARTLSERSEIHIQLEKKSLMMLRGAILYIKHS